MLHSLKYDDEHSTHYRIAPSTFCSDLNVIEVGYGKVPIGHKHYLRRNIFILHYIIDGEGVFCGQPFKKNYCYFVYPKELEIMVSDPQNPYESCWIMFKGNAANQIIRDCNLPKHNCVFEFEKAPECIKIIMDTIFNIEPSNDVEESFYLQAAFNKIMCHHFSNIKLKKNDYSVTKKVHDYLKASYTNPSASIDDIAKELNFSRNYIYTTFKKEYGISPQNYLIELRIKSAKELLLSESNLSVNDIALAVGYVDALYFSKLFHKKVGFSPRNFKKQNTINAPKSI